MVDIAKKTEDLWDWLIDNGVSEDTLDIITLIDGYSLDTLENVLYVTTGYRSLDQIEG